MPEEPDDALEWGLVDFLGRYHKHAIASEFPIPGSAVERDEARELQSKAQIDGIRERVRSIQAKRGESVQEKVRHAQFELKALIQKRVGSTLAKVGETLEEIDSEIDAFNEEQGRNRVAKYIEAAVIEPPKPPEGDGEFEEAGELVGLSDSELAASVADKATEFLKDRKELHDWWNAVRRGDSERLRILFLNGFQRPDVPDPEDEMDTVALELSIRRGDARMVELLLEFGADPNKKNVAGFGPLQSCWASWGPTHAADRMTQRDEGRRQKALSDERNTVDMLMMLLATGADANTLSPENRKCVLTEAVKRGPVQAVCALLQYGADAFLPDINRVSPLTVANDQVSADRVNAALLGPKKAKWRRVNPERKEILRVLKSWPSLQKEQRDDEFFGTWDSWLKRTETIDKKITAIPRDLRESASAQRVAEDAALDVCHRQLATSQKVRAFGTPFWAYDPVRRTLCCGPRRLKDQEQRSKMTQKFDAGNALARAHNQAPAQPGKGRPSGDYERGSSLPAARGASLIMPLAVPLDRYLLREATARDAGFLEVRDKDSPEEQARQDALSRQRERLLAKRADDRHKARTKAREQALATNNEKRSSLMAEASKLRYKTANMAAIFGTPTERRRTAVARAVSASGLDEGKVEKGATLSVLLTEQRTKVKSEVALTRVEKVRDDLRTLHAYGRLGRAKARLGESNALTNDAADFDDTVGGNVLLAVGARRRRQARLDRRFNQPGDLPPEREARRFAEAPPVQALAPLEKQHTSYSWAVQWPPDEADKVSEATRNDMARVSSIIAETEEAANRMQRPLDPVLVVKEEVDW